MVEIHTGLFVGTQDDYERDIRWRDGWRFVQACREPYHRRALGYSGPGAPKDHPEYLIARREGRLILNLLDHESPAYIHKEIIDEALAFIRQSLELNLRVLVHCNQGNSRGPSIGLLYLASYTDLFTGQSFPQAEDQFRELYPAYAPRAGVRGFLSTHWSMYCDGHDAFRFGNLDSIATPTPSLAT
jgi:hypothetical protein